MWILGKNAEIANKSNHTFSQKVFLAILNKLKEKFICGIVWLSKRRERKCPFLLKQSEGHDNIYKFNCNNCNTGCQRIPAARQEGLEERVTNNSKSYEMFERKKKIESAYYHLDMCEGRFTTKQKTIYFS